MWTIITLEPKIFITTFLAYIFFNFFSELSIKKNYKNVFKCGYHREKESYVNELVNIRKSMVDEISRLPEWLTFKEAVAKCRASSKEVNSQEQILLGCFISVRNRTKDFKYLSLPNFKKIEFCSNSLCERGLNHLSSLCKIL